MVGFLVLEEIVGTTNRPVSYERLYCSARFRYPDPHHE
jgi:hypothetical protein